MKLHLDKLNVPNSLRVAMKLLDYDPTLMKYFLNDQTSLKHVQNGGNKKFLTEEFDYKGTKYKFFINKDNDNVTGYKLHAEENPNTLYYDCIFILMDKQERVVNLRGLSYSEKCFKKETIENFKTNGSKLLNIAFEFARQLVKKYNLKYLTLQDNSQRICNNISIILPLMNTLLTGQTWYGKRGLLPKNPNKYEVELQLYKAYRKNIKIMESVKVHDVKKIKTILKSAYDEVKPKKISWNQIETIYDKHKDGLLKDFLSEYLKEFDKTCEMFAQFYIELSTKLELFNFGGSQFIYIFK
jgi:hypothetical protein